MIFSRIGHLIAIAMLCAAPVLVTERQALATETPQRSGILCSAASASTNLLPFELSAVRLRAEPSNRSGLIG